MRETYFLSSLDSYMLAPTRECTFIRRLTFGSGKECVLAEISPPLLGQPFGLSTDLTRVVIATRHEGESLSPVAPFPCFVFVARPLIDMEERNTVEKTDLEIVGWGELYRSRHDADHHVFDPGA